MLNISNHITAFSFTLSDSSFYPGETIRWWGGQVQQWPSPWHEVIIRVFSIYSSFKRMASEQNLFLL